MTKKKKQDGFFKEVFEEIAGSIIVEILWNIIIFIPRIIIRAILKIW